MFWDILRSQVLSPQWLRDDIHFQAKEILQFYEPN